MPGGLHRRPGPWIGLAVAALVGVLLAPRLYVADLEGSLVREANELVAVARARPAHVDAPFPGSFADALRGPLPRYQHGWKPLEDDDEAKRLLTAVATGARPVSDLPPALWEALDGLDGDLDAMLGASRAERADLGPDHDPWGPVRGSTWLPINAAAKHAAIRVRRAAGSTDRARPLRDCLDALALGRDAAIAGGLVGRMVRSGVVAVLASACGEALSRASSAEARDFAARVRRIRDAVPPYGTMLREEMIWVQLLMYGRGLAADRLAALRERPRAFAEDGSLVAVGALGRLRNRMVWRDLRSFQDRLRAAGARPACERDDAFAALGHAPLTLAIGLAGSGGPDPVDAYARYGRLDAIAELRLDVLVAAALARALRAETGRWPADARGLAAPGRLDAAEASRLGRLVVAEDRDGALDLVVPLPAVDAGGAPSEATLRLR